MEHSAIQWHHSAGADEEGDEKFQPTQCTEKKPQHFVVTAVSGYLLS